MTALYVIAAFGLLFGPSVLVVVLLCIRSARDLYPERAGRDDLHTVTPVRAPLAIEGKR